MSEGEQKLLDTPGDYLYVIRNGQEVGDPSWRSCRVVLTSERLVLSTKDGKQAIRHSNILVPDDDSLVPDEYADGSATPLKIGNNVILVDTQGIDDFESEYCRAALQDEVILARHPAKVGGVVQETADWSKARFRLEDDTVTLGFPDEQRVSFPIDDVGTIDAERQQVLGESRPTVKAKHTDEDGRSVETQFSGMEWHSRALVSLLEHVIQRRKNEYELSELESQVLMALYSGVSPFEMADFVGIDVDEVEEIYQQLLEVGAVDKIRERTEVSLNAHGRNLASEAMNKQ